MLYSCQSNSHLKIVRARSQTQKLSVVMHPSDHQATYPTQSDLPHVTKLDSNRECYGRLTFLPLTGCIQWLLK